MPNPKLLDQVSELTRFKHYSIRTEEAYRGWIRRFILFHGKRHPLEMGEMEVNAFLSDLAARQNVAVATQNQALNAIVFLYRHVLRRDLGYLGVIERPKRRAKLLSEDKGQGRLKIGNWELKKKTGGHCWSPV